MPISSEVKQKYREFFIDSNNRTRFKKILARLNGILVSDEFKKSVGVKTVTKEAEVDGKKVKETKEESSPFYDELIDKFISIEGSVSARRPSDCLKGFDDLINFPAMLKHRFDDGNTLYDKLKAAAPSGRIKTADFLDDLYFLDEKLGIGNKKWLDMPRFDPKSAEKKKKLTGEPSWKNYMEAHLTDVPHSTEGKKEYLAKAMTAAFRNYRQGIYPESTAPFSVKTARTDSEKLMKDPVFKIVFSVPSKVLSLMEIGAREAKSKASAAGKGKKPDSLAEATIQIYRPFYATSPADIKNILRNIKNMSMLMDSIESGDTKWRILYSKIEDVNPDNPAHCTEKKIQEIFDATVAYTKGKKSLRSNPKEQRMFNQSLDLLAEFSKGSEYAKASVQTVFDRINEVRRGHDKNYKGINQSSYGLKGIVKHTKKGPDAKNAFKDKYRLPSEERFVRNVFEPYPKNDKSLLYNWPENEDDSPLRVNTQLRLLENFTDNYERDSYGMPDTTKLKKLSLQEATEGVARILALSELQMFYLDKKKLKDYFPKDEYGDFTDEELLIKGDKVRGDHYAIFSGPLAVVSKNAFLKKYNEYMKDPVVKYMAQKYMAPGSRAVLTGEFKSETIKGNPKQGSIRAQRNNDNIIVTDKKKFPGEPISEKPDAKAIDVNLLKLEYSLAKNALASKKPVL